MERGAVAPPDFSRNHGQDGCFPFTPSRHPLQEISASRPFKMAVSFGIGKPSAPPPLFCSLITADSALHHLMPAPDSQTFLRELDKKLWTAADKLRSNLDAAVYKHAVLGHVFQKGAQASRLSRPSKQPRWLFPLPSPATSTRTGACPGTAQRRRTPTSSWHCPARAARSHPRSHSADRPNGRINPPFNIMEWWDGKLEGDARWSRSEAESASHAQFYKNRGKYGTPPQTAMRECAPLKSEGTPQVVSEAKDKNANFAWVQHMLKNLPRQSATTPGLAPNGSMACCSPMAR